MFDSPNFAHIRPSIAATPASHLCASDYLAPLACRGYRVTEAQESGALLRLVDSAQEHDVLEQLIERSRPRLLPQYHRLARPLADTLRFSAPPGGSRFGGPADRNPLYGARSIETALADAARRRINFLSGMQTPVCSEIVTSHLSFGFDILSDRGLDLTLPTLCQTTPDEPSALQFARDQQLGKEMRDNKIDAFMFPSAHPSCRYQSSVGVLDPCALIGTIVEPSTWVCRASTRSVLFVHQIAHRCLEFRSEELALDTAQYLRRRI